MMRKLLLTIGPALLLTGCLHALAPDADESPVRIESVEARFEPGDRGMLALAMTVQSPGFAGNEVSGVQWELWLDQRWFAAGTHRISEPLPASGDHPLALTVPFVFRRAMPASTAPSEVELGVRGRLVVDGPGGTRSWPFQLRKRVEVTNAPVVDDFNRPH